MSASLAQQLVLSFISDGSVWAGGALLACGGCLIGATLVRRGRNVSTAGLPSAAELRGEAPVAGLRAHLNAARAAEAQRKELARLIEASREASELSAREIDERLGRLEETLRRADMVLARLEGPERASSHGDRAGATIACGGDERVGGDELSRRIGELARAGRSPVEIAREVGEQAGKVRLMLALLRSAERV